MIDQVQKYQILLQWEESTKTHIALIPELGDLTVRGSSREEALKLGEQAIQRHIAELKAKHLPVPLPFAEKKYSGKIFIRVKPTLHRDVALKAAMAGLSINQFVEGLLKKSDA